MIIQFFYLANIHAVKSCAPSPQKKFAPQMNAMPMNMIVVKHSFQYLPTFLPSLDSCAKLVRECVEQTVFNVFIHIVWMLNILEIELT